jgi:zinc D-Ala-D-Ala carboxypeptidase
VTDKQVSRRGLLKGALAIPLVTGAATVGRSESAKGQAWGRTLERGSTGADVGELQIRVAGWAADVAKQTYVVVDSSFGPATEAAVQRFQASHGIVADGIVGSRTIASLDALEDSDSSTRHFDWAEFVSPDGSGFDGGMLPRTAVRENVRRLMYKLEALRHKAGACTVTICSGFRSVAFNQDVGGADTSMHLYGGAADIAVRRTSTHTVYRLAETCGFSGLESPAHSWQHVDSRIEHPYQAQSYWWEGGVL